MANLIPTPARPTGRTAVSRPLAGAFSIGRFTGEPSMNWREIADDREKYAAYLCSREWGAKKEEVHRRASGKCERCYVRPIDAVHHLTYVRKYAELATDLQGLCKACHEFIHSKSNDDPRMQDVPVPLNTTDWADGCSLLCPRCGTDCVLFARHDRPNDLLLIVECACSKCPCRFDLVLQSHKDWSWLAVRNTRIAKNTDG